MNCRFLETLSLETLLAPATTEQFNTHHWDKAPLIVHRNDPNYYGNLFTLEDFDFAVATDPDLLRTADAVKKQSATYENPKGTSAREKVLADMRSGNTLILNYLDHREPKLGLLCRLLSQKLGHRFQTNLYLTPPGGQGFKPHYDNHDVFILQILGFKHWKIEKNRRAWPNRGINSMPEDEREFRGDVNAFTLNQGDLIYIPRGYIHGAECGSEPSLHITLGVHPYTWEDLLGAVFKARIRDDEQLTHALPLGFLHDHGTNLVKRMMAALGPVTDEAYLSAIVDEFKDNVVTQYPLDVMGQVSTFFRPVQLQIEDRVGPRPGIVYRTHLHKESIRINFGNRTIDFPDFLKEPLEFALNTVDYPIRDIPGDLEDSEKLVFVERLIQEGFVVRKGASVA